MENRQLIIQKQINQLYQNVHVHQVEASSDLSRLIVKYAPTMTNTIYDNNLYRIKVQIPDQYPQKPPKLYLLDIFYHLNVNKTTGQILFSLLKDDWCSFITLSSIIQVIDSCLAQPDLNNPANNAILKEYKQRNTTYFQNVRESIQKLKFTTVPIVPQHFNQQQDKVTNSKLNHEDDSPNKKNSKKGEQQQQIYFSFQQNQVQIAPNLVTVQNQGSKKHKNSISIEMQQDISPPKSLVQYKIQKKSDQSVRSEKQKLLSNDIQNPTKIYQGSQKVQVNYYQRMKICQEKQKQQKFESIEDIESKIKNINEKIDFFSQQQMKLESKLKSTTHLRLKNIIEQQLQEQVNHLIQLYKLSSETKKRLMKRLKQI